MDNTDINKNSETKQKNISTEEKQTVYQYLFSMSENDVNSMLQEIQYRKNGGKLKSNSIVLKTVEIYHLDPSIICNLALDEFAHRYKNIILTLIVERPAVFIRKQ